MFLVILLVLLAVLMLKLLGLVLIGLLHASFWVLAAVALILLLRETRPV